MATLVNREQLSKVWLRLSRLPSLTATQKTLSNALIITRREVRDSFRDWRIVGPIVILTFLFPSLAQFFAGRFTEFLTGFGAQLIGERTIPFLLMIVGFFPISISLVIALETFVGEKERRSLEPLLSTPLTNTELYIGKTLSAMIPPLVSSFGGMAVYLSSLLFSELAWRPQPMLVFQIVLLTTVQALVMVTGAVVVSSQTTSTRAANLLASFIIIPMTLVIQGESVVMFLAPDADSPGGITALWAIIVGMFFVVVLLLRVGNSIFNREELLGRTIDQLNLRRTAGRIWQTFRAVDAQGTPAANPLQWYRHSLPLSLRRQRDAILVTLLVFTTAFVIGFVFGLQPQWRLPFVEQSAATMTSVGMDEVAERLFAGDLQITAMGMIVEQNGRILIGALLLSLFSFGVAALVLTPAVYAVLGYIVSQVILTGPANLVVVAAAVLPHGMIEIPMIVIATAAAFRLGAIVTKPPAGQTVGQAWISALSDTLKLTVGIVIPALFLAAALEVFVTPRVVLAILGGS